MRTRLLRLMLVCGLVLAALIGSPDAEARRNKLTVQDQYELGLKYMNRGYYVKALEQFNRIRNYHRDDPFAVKAELAIADVYFKKNEWDQARLAYEDFMRMHPRHGDLDYVVFRIGMSLFKKSPRAAGRDQTWTRQAVASWKRFDSRFPESGYAEEVAEKYDLSVERLARKEYQIARFYARRGAWVSVEGRAGGLLKTFPGSDVEARSLALLAQSYAWQGAPDRAEQALAQVAETDPRLADRARRRVKRANPEKFAEDAGR